MKDFKPMLSGEAPKDLSTLKYPVYVSPKLDGIRALVIDGVLVSRNLKPIRNHVLQQRYGVASYNGLDGELICGDPTAKDCFRVTTSAVMSADGDASDVKFFLFDNFSSSEGWVDRTSTNQWMRLSMPGARQDLLKVPHTLCYGPDEVMKLEEKAARQGFEGVMLRDPLGPYKQGRSTTKEGYLLKLKRFADMEAVVVDVEEQMHNANEATKDNLGHTKRSTAKAGKRGKNTLGALIVRGLNGPYKGVEFNVGTGFDDALRQRLWNANPVGKTVKVKYFPTGSDKAPRFPTFLGFRDPSDM